MIEENKILIKAVREGNLKQIKELMKDNKFEAIDNYGNTILHIGARSARPGVFDYIFEKALAEGVDLNIVNKLGSTPLDMAINLDNKVVIKAFESQGIRTGIILKEENNLPEELIQAIRKGNLEKTIEFFKSGANIKAVDNSGNNWAHYAVSNYEASHENIKIFKFILSNAEKTDLIATNKMGWTPLDIANYNENSQVVDAFKEIGISANSASLAKGGGTRSAGGGGASHGGGGGASRGGGGVSRSTVDEDNRVHNITLPDLNTNLYNTLPVSNYEIEKLTKKMASGLIHAASHPMCDNNATAVNAKLKEIREDPTVLQNEGMLANILNSRNANGYTALHVACLNGSPVSVKALIEAGANIEAKNKDGRTPLHVAAFSDNSEVAKVLLIGGANPNVKDTFEKWGPLQIATQPQNMKKSKYGVAPKNSDQTQDNKTLEFAEVLLGCGAEVDWLDKDDCTSLMQAAVSNLPGVVKLLIKWGADPNKQTNEGYEGHEKWTALHIASASLYGISCAESIKILLNEGGADVSILNQKKQTALEISSNKPHDDVKDLLLTAQFISNPNIVLTNGENIFNLVARLSRIDLLDKANSTSTTKVNLFNAKGNAPIHSACAVKNMPNNPAPTEFLKALISMGGNVNLVAGDGYNPLQISAEIGSTGYIKLLLEKGANVNSANEKDGNTALHYATMKGQSGAVEALLEEGANHTIRNHKGENAFDISTKNKDMTIIGLLNSRPSTSTSSSYPATSFSSSRWGR